MDKQLFLLLLSSALTFLVTWYWFNRKAVADTARLAKEEQDKKNQQLFDRIVELEKQSVLISQLVGPISTAFQAILVKELTHFHTPELDALLTKVGPPYALTQEEETRLTDLLADRAKNLNLDIEESEREAALLLPFVMKRVRRITIALSQFNLVIVPRELLFASNMNENKE